MDIVPDTALLSQVMVQATAPAFILGAVAGFISILPGRMTSVIDRIRSLNEIVDGDTAAQAWNIRLEVGSGEKTDAVLSANQSRPNFDCLARTSGRPWPQTARLKEPSSFPAAYSL
jgi:hypothetical protein